MAGAVVADKGVRDVHPVPRLEVDQAVAAEVHELVQIGALPAQSAAGGAFVFSARVVTVARTACRLRDELELDLPSLGVALRLLERVRDLEEELERVRALLPRD